MGWEPPQMDPLSRDSEGGSFVLFGAIDPYYTTKGISWIPLSAETYWQISMERYSQYSLPSSWCFGGVQAHSASLFPVSLSMELQWPVPRDARPSWIQEPLSWLFLSGPSGPS